MDSAAHLEAALDELETVLVRAPVVHAGLAPGLSDPEVDLLIEPIAPLVLPLDLRVLYRWHDGHDSFTPDGYVEVFPDEPFLPLGEAVGQYSMWLQGDPYWNPLWFPAFGDQHGAFVELGSTPNRLAGPVWDFHYQDSEVSAAFDSILAMVQTFVAVWRTADVNELELVGPDMETLREHNPRSFAPNGRRTRVLSKGVMEGWPEEWIAAARPLPKELESDDRGRFYG